MISQDAVKDLIQEFNTKSRDKTFAEFIATLYKDKFIEIYLGDSYEEISMEQISMSYPAVFCGKVVAAYKECLIINGAFADKSKKFHMGNLVFINERAIRALNEVDGNGIIEDMFVRSSESVQIKNIMEKK